MVDSTCIHVNMYSELIKRGLHGNRTKGFAQR